MKTLAFIGSASLILLLAFWLSSPPAPKGAASPSELVSVVPEARAATAPTPQPTRLVASAPHSPLAQAIAADKGCETVRLLSTLDITQPREAASILGAIGAPPALQELFAEKGPLNPPADAKLKSFHTPLTRLIFALATGGIYPGLEPKRVDLTKARDLLLALEKEDPTNAAYPYFLLDVEKRRGASQGSLAKIAARAAQATRFESYLVAAQREIQANRFESSAAFQAIETLLQALDTANLYSSGRILQAIDKENGSTYAGEVGTLLQQAGLRARRGAFFYDFSAREFDMGRELQGNHGPDAASLSLEKEGLPMGFTYPTGAWLEEDGSCDEAKLEEEFQAVRNFL